MSLRFGLSGNPLSAARPGTVAGIARVRELGLDCLEMAWVRGVRVRTEGARRIAETARACGVELTAHAPYYVNLCGRREVVARSRDRLAATARLGALCGARSFCFHAGFYGGQPPRRAAARIRHELGRLVARLGKEGNPIHVRPELTGKPSQAGSLEEILEWSAEIPGVRPCIDFAHQHARTVAFNRYEDFCEVLERVRARLGPAALQSLHVHVSGIDYGPRGERRHLPLRESDFRYRELLRALRDHGASGWVIAESPRREADALVLQRAWRRL